MLTTFDVSPHEGRVCYVTDNGEKRSVTVECPNEKVALWFETEDKLKTGDWVRISGQARIDPSERADGSPAEASIYYHEPHDGSSITDWMFKKLEKSSFVLIGPPQFSSRMHDTMLCLRRHLDSWEKNLELSKWEETSAVLQDVLSMVNMEIDERKPAPVVAIEFKFDLDL